VRLSDPFRCATMPPLAMNRPSSGFGRGFT
jgi:hypothetical protein